MVLAFGTHGKCGQTRFALRPISFVRARWFAKVHHQLATTQTMTEAISPGEDANFKTISNNVVPSLKFFYDLKPTNATVRTLLKKAMFRHAMFQKKSLLGLKTVQTVF